MISPAVFLQGPHGDCGMGFGAPRVPELGKSSPDMTKECGDLALATLIFDLRERKARRLFGDKFFCEKG